jgi:hypothetical protein
MATEEITSTPMDRAWTACWDAVDATWQAVERILAFDLNGAWAVAYPSIEACGMAIYTAIAPMTGAG